MEFNRTDLITIHTLKELIDEFKKNDLSILDYTIYIDDSKNPIVVKKQSDYEPYLNYNPFYVIENATFDDITYRKVIRLLSPKATKNGR